MASASIPIPIPTSIPASIPASILCVGMGWFPDQPGGLDRYVYDLSAQLIAQQDRVELCGVGLSHVQPPFPLQITHLADPTDPLWRRLWSAQRQFQQRQMTRPDAINLHFALYSLPLLPALPPDVPITFTFHGPWARESQQEGAGPWAAWLKYWLVERPVFRRCDRFITLSQSFATLLHRTYGVPEAAIAIIPGGVDLTRFQPSLTPTEARHQLGWPLDRPILFTPRRLVQRMGLDQLLTAIAIVKQHIPDLWLAIAGRGPLQEPLQRQIQDLALTDQVQLLGFLPEAQLPIAYQAADLCVMPSQALEGFGLVLLESLACGTPALCTPVGGMPEVLLPFSPQLVTEDCGAVAIATRLEDSLTGAIALPSRTDCRDYASQFAWPTIAQRVRQVLLKPLC